LAENISVTTLAKVSGVFWESKANTAALSFSDAFNEAAEARQKIITPKTAFFY
jgi:hypothetical protein